MFFILSKIFWALASPLSLVFLLLVCGFAAGFFSKRIGRSIVVLGMVLFTAFGIFPVGRNMLLFLEGRYERPVPLPDRVDGILVLGGSFMTDISEGRGVPALNETAERVTDALALARHYPDAVLVFSGGNGKLRGGERTEADDTALFLEQFGFPQDNVILESESRNTYENILLSRDLVFPQEEETWILVTSAYHMPRAYEVARALGWGNIIPWPADYRTSGKTGWLPDGFDLLGHMHDTDVALHEMIGLLAYQLSGKIYLPSH